MGPFQALALGIIQGLTEFFPVSSSGHLVIFQHIFGLNEPELLFDVCVHVGTLAAIIFYFFKDIDGIIRACFRFSDSFQADKSQGNPPENPELKMGVLIIIGTIPTAMIGVGLNSISHTLFSSVRLVGVALLITAALLLGTRWLKKPVPSASDFSYVQAFFIGVVQGLAIVPGISRSGSTIAAGLYLGIAREEAARFSFLLSVPAILGALLLSIITQPASGWVPLHILIIGMASSAITGYLALSVLVRIVKNGHLYYFAPYCILVGLIAMGMGN